jgi:hypothetical protein
MIVNDPSALLSGQPNPLVALIHRKHRRVIMNLFLFMLEIFVIVAAIALVPARSELRISRARAIDDEPDQKNSLRS